MNLINKLIIGSLGTTAGASIAGEIIENKMRDYDTIVEPPVDSVTIIIPTYNESKFIKQSLNSIKKQSIVEEYPDMFEYILIDSGSTDNTVELARPFMTSSVDKIVYVSNDDSEYNFYLSKKAKSDRVILTDKKGKLTARNEATDQANGNIIVSVDADCVYPYHFLNTLLKPFIDTSVIAVDGSTIDYSIPKIPGRLFSLFFWIEHDFRYPNRLHGRHSAYKKSAFNKIGKFDESINQLNVYEMLQEEEIRFGNKMSHLGKVVWKVNASCEHLGGFKVSCRGRGLNKGSNACKDSGVGIERFGY